jgi:hypothetical protein
MLISQHDGDAGEGDQQQMWYTVAGFLIMLLEPGAVAVRCVAYGQHLVQV